MDLLTQACLGAGLGELVLGRRVGSRAAAWGAGLGVLPDADALLTPLLNDLQELTWHRSLTHSLVFVAAVPPLLGLALHRRYREESELRSWVALAYLVIATHVLLDCCTTFGTQVFFPFSARPVALRCVSVIDPLVTIPLLVALIGCPFLAREGPGRRWLNRAGLALAATYLLVLVGIKLHVDGVHDETLAREGFSARRTLSKPTMGNGLLWRLVAEDAAGYRVGYYSLLDAPREVERVRYVPRGELGAWAREPQVARLLAVLDGCYAVSEAAGEAPVIHDLRYGQWEGWSREETPYVFSYRLERDAGGAQVRAIPRPPPPPTLRQTFLARLRGRP